MAILDCNNIICQNKIFKKESSIDIKQKVFKILGLTHVIVLVTAIYAIFIFKAYDMTILIGSYSSVIICILYNIFESWMTSKTTTSSMSRSKKDPSSLLPPHKHKHRARLPTRTGSASTKASIAIITDTIFKSKRMH